MKTQLLCTFTNQKNLEQTTHDITKNFNVIFEKIYVLQNENKTNELICTYNVDQEEEINFNDVKNTISLHRKKITNTLYTINALNELIMEINNGVLDKTFPVKWENYMNTLLLTNESGLNQIPTKIYSIVDIKKWEKDKKI